jgi:hypothetical protein
MVITNKTLNLVAEFFNSLNMFVERLGKNEAILRARLK